MEKPIPTMRSYAGPDRRPHASDDIPHVISCIGASACQFMADVIATGTGRPDDRGLTLAADSARPHLAGDSAKAVRPITRNILDIDARLTPRRIASPTAGDAARHAFLLLIANFAAAALLSR